MKPLVAIVGRPNVGKSTLFNRLARRRLALVEDVPGVTRDRHYADAEWGGKLFTFIDTGGFVPGEEDGLLQAVREQAQLAVEECELVLFVTDGRAGLTSTDQEIGTYLRKSGKPVLLVANKLDSHKVRDQLEGDFYALGLGEVFGLSAEHGLGIEPLMETVLDALPHAPSLTSEPEVPEEDGAVRLAIVGRPNVGKSTLINSLLKQKRLVASEVPGTTRDPIDSEIQFKGQRIILTDTAGIRRKKTIAQRLEQFSVVASLRVIDRSHVAVLLVDATEPAVDQDAKIAGIAEEKGRALLIVVNKWDLISDQRKQEALRDELKYKLKFVSYAPMIFTSALSGQKVDKVLEISTQLYEQFHFRAPTPHLNRLLEHMMENNPAPIVQGRPLRLYYVAQVASAPPTFAFTCNKPDGVPDSYKRYIVNQLRETFDLKVPIHLVFRPRPGQAKRAARKKASLVKKPRRRTE